MKLRQNDFDPLGATPVMPQLKTMHQNGNEISPAACPSCEKARQLRELVASGRTHWEGCWRDHLSCAVARAKELESLAEIGRRMKALPIGAEVTRFADDEWEVGGTDYEDGYVTVAEGDSLLDVLRAAQIGEEVTRADQT